MHKGLGGLRCLVDAVDGGESALLSLTRAADLSDTLVTLLAQACFAWLCEDMLILLEIVRRRRLFFFFFFF